jgi:PEGA domain
MKMFPCLERLMSLVTVFTILSPSFAQSNQAPIASPGAQPSLSGLVLQDGTPVRLRFNRTISSADARIGDEVDFEVLEDVRVNGVIVISKGATALGTVTVAQSKRRMARGGKLDITVDFVRLVDSEKAALRAVKEGKGGGHTGAMTVGIVATGLVFWPAAPLFLLVHGKDFTIPKNTEIIAYVNGDMTLGQAATQAVASVSMPDPPHTAKLTSVAVASAAPVQEGKTILQLTSEPDPGADIEVDGNFVGQTPSRLELANGDHTLRLTMKGFAPWERKLHAGGGSVTIDAKLKIPTYYRVQ